MFVCCTENVLVESGVPTKCASMEFVFNNSYSASRERCLRQIQHADNSWRQSVVTAPLLLLL